MIYLAPLQGYTDFIYRNAFSEVFPGIDVYFVPYISSKKGKILKKYIDEILPENNRQKKVIPQVLTGDEEEIILLSKTLTDFGYKEINLNLGCPYPMVTNQKRGSGLLPFPAQIEKIVYSFFENSSLKLSVKMRAGLINSDELEKVIPILNKFPLTEIILHPRIAKQLYKGDIIESAYHFVKNNSPHNIVYNGNIFTTDDFFLKQKILFGNDNIMLGRGILMNPFLLAEIKGIVFTKNEKEEKLKTFHEFIFEGYNRKLDNSGNVLNKLKLFWSYFSFIFDDHHKILKKIKKCNSINGYHAEVQKILGNYSVT